MYIYIYIHIYRRYRQIETYDDKPVVPGRNSVINLVLCLYR